MSKYSRFQDESRGTAATTTGLLGGALLVSLVALILVSILLPLYVNKPCTKACGDLTVACDELCVTDLIVGGGTTGLSLANSLSDDPTKNVLVLEAGGNYVNDVQANNPGNGLAFESLYLLQPYRYYYQILSTLQLATSQMTSNAGRLLGGTGAINDCVMFKGTPEFWDALDAATGSTGRFASESVYALFKSIEWLNATDVYVPDATRGLTENAWKLEVIPRILNTSDDANLIAQLFASALGFDYPNSLGGNDYDATVGVFPSYDMLYDFNATSDPLVRWTPQKAFLNDSVVDPDTLVGVEGRPLRVLIHSEVQRILFHPDDDTKAVGVQYVDTLSGAVRRAWATSNVIVSAFMQTAPLLQRSGIGPQAVLDDANITARVVNENVGANWRYHNYVVLTFLYPNVTGVANAADAPLISGLSSVFTPDPVLGTSPTQRGFQYVTITFPGVMAAFTFQLRGTSTGTISVYTNDSQQFAQMSPNLLSEPNDVVSWRTHLRTTIAALQDTDPNVVCLSIDDVTLNDDDLFAAWLAANTNYGNALAHSFGTARVGTDASDGVVDTNFTVFGAKNLRVCDTQVFRDQVDGNPSYAAAGLGQICAQAIKGLAPTPPTKKRTRSKQPKQQHKMEVHSKRTTSLTREDYNTIVAYFESLKATHIAPQDARQIIANIQATTRWQELNALYGPYAGKKK